MKVVWVIRYILLMYVKLFDDFIPTIKKQKTNKNT